MYCVLCRDLLRFRQFSLARADRGLLDEGYGLVFCEYAGDACWKNNVLWMPFSLMITYAHSPSWLGWVPFFCICPFHIMMTILLASLTENIANGSLLMWNRCSCANEGVFLTFLTWSRMSRRWAEVSSAFICARKALTRAKSCARSASDSDGWYEFEEKEKLSPNGAGSEWLCHRIRLKCEALVDQCTFVLYE